MLLVGDPGLGTTTLLTVVAQRARRRGVRRHHGEHDERRRAPAERPRRASRHPWPFSSTTARTPTPHQLADGPAPRRRPGRATVPDRRRRTALDRCLQALATWPRLVLPPARDGRCGRDPAEGAGRGRAPRGRLPARRGAGRQPAGTPRGAAPPHAEQRSGTAPLPAHLPVPPALDRAWGRVIDGLPPPPGPPPSTWRSWGPAPTCSPRWAQDDGWGHADLAALVDAGVAVATTDVTPDFVHAVVRDVVLHRTPATTRAGAARPRRGPGDAAGPAPAHRGPPPRPRGRDRRRGGGGRGRGRRLDGRRSWTSCRSPATPGRPPPACPPRRRRGSRGPSAACAW